MVLPDSNKISRVPLYLGTTQERVDFAHWTITIFGLPFQTVKLVFSFVTLWCVGSHTRMAPLPRQYNAYQLYVFAVWAIPRSLATTRGISIDLFSYRYLDVSVPYVCLTSLCIQLAILEVCSSGFSHSEIFGSKLV